jgi:hypothetical protein
VAARQLTLDLLARDKTGQATKSAADNLEDVGDAAEDAAKSTEKLGKEADKAEGQTDKLGKSARTAAQHVDKLDREIESVEKELKQLAVAYTEAQSASDRADLSKAIRRTESDLKKLAKARALIGSDVPQVLAPDPKPIVAAAKSIGQLENELVRLKAAYVNARTEAERTNLAKLISSNESQLSNLRKFGTEAGTSFLSNFAKAAMAKGPLGPVGAGMGIYLGFLIGTNISAGLLGGAGIGGVIGGLVLAKRDSRVQAAAKELGDEVLGALDKSAGAFVPAALQGIEQIRASFKRVDKDLASIFNNSARFVKPLINAVTGFIENVVDGAEKAVRGARPVIDALERYLPRLGDALGDVFASVADNGPEAAVALGQLFDIIEIGVRSVGFIVNGLTELYGLLAGGGILGSKAQAEWLAYKVAADKAAASGQEFADGQRIVADKAKTAAEAVEAERKAIETLNSMMRAGVDPLFAFLDAQDRVTAAQKAYDEALKEHGPNSAEAAAASRDLAAAALDVNDAASKVGTTADGKLTPALRRVLEQAKLTPAEIRAIETELARAQAQADKWDKTNATALFYAHTAKAANDVGALLAKMAKVKNKHVTVSVGVVVGNAIAGAVSDVNRILKGRAAGGPVRRGEAYIVGERRPEVFVPETDGQIIPSVNRAGGMSASAGGTLTVAASGALDDLERMFLKMLRTRPAFAAAAKTLINNASG